MKKLLAMGLVLILLCSFVACGDSGSAGGATQDIGEVQTVGNIKLMVPDGWVVIPGDAGGIENDDALFLKKSEDATEYLWIKIVSEANMQASLDSNHEDDIAPFTLDGAEWTGKVNMITTSIDDTIWFVATYGYEGFTDETVRAVLASLQAV